MSLGRFGAVGILVAALCLIAFLGFVFLRACNGCGSKKPTRGIWFGKETRSYSTQQISSIKIATFFVIMPIIVGVVFGLVTNKEVTNQTDSIGQSFVNTGTEALNEIQRVTNDIVTIPITKNATSLASNTYAAAQEINKKMDYFQMLVSNYDIARTAFLYAGLVGSAVLCTAALASVGFNLRRLSFAAGLFAFWVCAIVWISFGAHFATAKLAYDMCNESSLLITQLNSSKTAVAPPGPLAELWGCAPNSYFGRLNNIVNKAKSIAVNGTCTKLQSMCFYYNVHCPSISCSDETAMYMIVHQVTIEESGINRTIYDCAFECQEEFYKNTSIAVLQNLSYLYNYTTELGVLGPYVSCRYILPMLSSIEPPLCGDVLKSHYGVGVANLIVGIFMIALIILLIMGYKRFLPIAPLTSALPYKPRSISNVGLLELSALSKEKVTDGDSTTDEEPELRRNKSSQAME